MGRSIRLAAALWLALLAVLPIGPVAPVGAAAGAALASPDFFGVVGRDPWYEFDDATGQPKRAFQEAMTRQIAATGARWVRIGFHTVYVTAGGRVANTINFAETDAFITELAPRYGLKVLALLNTGILSDQDPFNYNRQGSARPGPPRALHRRLCQPVPDHRSALPRLDRRLRDPQRAQCQRRVGRDHRLPAAGDPA